MSGAAGQQTLSSAISQRDRMIAAESNKGHTILFIQFTADDNSRTYLDYDDIGRCVDGLCQLYEQKLKI
jgi:Enhancer of rudimentary